jgi:hypothetical protein
MSRRPRVTSSWTPRRRAPLLQMFAGLSAAKPPLVTTSAEYPASCRLPANSVAQVRVQPSHFDRLPLPDAAAMHGHDPIARDHEFLASGLAEIGRRDVEVAMRQLLEAFEAIKPVVIARDGSVSSDVPGSIFPPCGAMIATDASRRMTRIRKSTPSRSARRNSSKLPYLSLLMARNYSPSRWIVGLSGEAKALTYNFTASHENSSRMR